MAGRTTDCAASWPCPRGFDRRLSLRVHMSPATRCWWMQGPVSGRVGARAGGLMLTIMPRPRSRADNACPLPWCLGVWWGEQEEQVCWRRRAQLHSSWAIHHCVDPRACRTVHPVSVCVILLLPGMHLCVQCNGCRGQARARASDHCVVLGGGRQSSSLPMNAAVM